MLVARMGLCMPLTATYICRVCKAQRVTLLGTFSDVPLPDGSQPELSCELAELVIGYCPDCKMVQRIGDTDLSDYYQGFAYTVGGSPFVRRFVNALAEVVVNTFAIRDRKKPIRVLDIGCNSGEQLMAFRDLGCDVIGVEPSGALAMLAAGRGISVMNAEFDSDLAETLYGEHGHMDVVISTFTLDQVDDPADFLKGVKKLLDPESGRVVLEVHDVNITYASAEIALFDREHSIYPDCDSLATLLNLAGLEVIETNFLPATLCRENSLLVMAKQAINASQAAVPSKSSCDLDGHLEAFALLESGIQNLADFLDDCIARGLRIAGYGAGYRGTMYCSLVPNASGFSYFVDGNTSLHGSRMPKSCIPVYPPEQLFSNPVDYVVVFSHGYLMEIQANCQSLGYPESSIVSLPRILSGDVQCVDIGAVQSNQRRDLTE
ncbi:MAG: class I SAM-dependent methyltransferase [Armatimonadota bacterium]